MWPWMISLTAYLGALLNGFCCCFSVLSQPDHLVNMFQPGLFGVYLATVLKWLSPGWLCVEENAGSDLPVPFY